MPFRGRLLLEPSETERVFTVRHLPGAEKPRYVGARGEEWPIPDGFRTDLGSVPKLLRWLVSTWGPGLTRAFVVHDILCRLARTGKFSRADADGVMRRVMREYDVGRVRWAYWVGVRIGAIMEKLKAKVGLGPALLFVLLLPVGCVGPFFEPVSEATAEELVVENGNVKAKNLRIVAKGQDRQMSFIKDMTVDPETGVVQSYAEGSYGTSQEVGRDIRVSDNVRAPQMAEIQANAIANTTNSLLTGFGLARGSGLGALGGGSLGGGGASEELLDALRALDERLRTLEGDSAGEPILAPEGTPSGSLDGVNVGDIIRLARDNPELVSLVLSALGEDEPTPDPVVPTAPNVGDPDEE